MSNPITDTKFLRFESASKEWRDTFERKTDDAHKTIFSKLDHHAAAMNEIKIQLAELGDVEKLREDVAGLKESRAKLFGVLVAATAILQFIGWAISHIGGK
jgi:hypothetical protein